MKLLKYLPGYRRDGRKPGFGLMELIVSVAMLAFFLLTVLQLIPMSGVASQKASDVQTASLYAQEVVEDASRFAPAASGPDMSFDVTLNRTRFHVDREIYEVEASRWPRLYDVVVTVSWNTQPQPVSLRTRVYR